MNEVFNLFDADEALKQIKSTDWKWTMAKDYPKDKNGIKVFSCFACGGGSTMGYKLTGCEVVGCCEIDPRMNEVYVANHHPKHNFLMDIREFNSIPDDQLPLELFNLDVLDGSPPCTTFSMAGDREDSWGKKKKFREGQAEQTLDDLSFVFIDTVKKLKPKVVIMENVEGLLLGEAFSYVQKIYKKMNDAGYFLHHWLLKGETMGVPQTRHRVFFIGIRADLGIDPSYLDMSFNYAPVQFGIVKEGVGRKLNDGTEIKKWLILSNENDKRIADVVVRHGQNEKLFTHKIFQDHNVAQTLAASGDYYRGKEKEKISWQDARNIQTFPQDYNFGNEDVQYICGMSVPPIMIKRIMTKLIDQDVFDYKDKCPNCGAKMMDGGDDDEAD